MLHPKAAVSRGFVTLLVGLFVLGGYYVALEYAGTGISKERKACLDSIASIDDAGEAFERAEHYFNERNYDLECARVAYARAAELDPQVDKWLWYQFGRIDFLEGAFDGAIYKFDRQVEYFGSEAVNVHYMRGLTYGYRARDEGRESDWQMAEEEFKQYLSLDPFSPWARTDLAWVYFSQGKYEEMKPVLEWGLRRDPEHPWLLNMYGLALLNTGERDAARRHFAKALKEAQDLTVEDWGRSYPGNDPGSWPKGLAEMQQAIAKNLEIATQS